MVTTVTFAASPGFDPLVNQGFLSVWHFHFLSVPVWVPPGPPVSFHNPKTCRFRLDYSKLLIGVIVSVSGCLPFICFYSHCLKKPCLFWAPVSEQKNTKIFTNIQCVLRKRHFEVRVMFAQLVCWNESYSRRPWVLVIGCKRVLVWVSVQLRTGMSVM